MRERCYRQALSEGPDFSVGDIRLAPFRRFLAALLSFVSLYCLRQQTQPLRVASRQYDRQ